MQKYRYPLIGFLVLLVDLGLTGALAPYLTMGGYLMFMSILPGVILLIAMIVYAKHEEEEKREYLKLGVAAACLFEVVVVIFANHVFNFKTVDGTVLKMTATNYVASVAAYVILALLGLRLGSGKKKN